MRSAPLTTVVLCACLAIPAGAQLPSWIAWSLPEARVNDTAELPVESLATAVAPDGSSAAVWVANSFTVWARPLDSTGHAAGADHRIDDTASGLFRLDTTVAALEGGGYAAAWATAQTLPTGPATLWLRPLGADTSPSASPQRIDTAGGADAGTLRLAPLSSGGLVAAWAERGDDALQRLVARRFDSRLSAQEAPVTVATAVASVCRIQLKAVGALLGGGYQAVWTVLPDPGVPAPDCVGTYSRQLGAEGQPAGPAVRLEADADADAAAVRSDGSIVALTSQDDAFVQLFAADGHALSPRRAVAAGPGIQVAADVAVDRAGGFLALWSSGTVLTGQLPVGEDVWGRFYAPDGTPLGGSVRINTNLQSAAFDQILPHAASNGRGAWSVSWADRYTMGLSHFYGGDGWAAHFASCPAGGFCLGTGHFRLAVAWRDPRTGATGSGQAIAVAGETGAFWFFDEANIELFAKVLDGRGVNGHFWVFYGSLSDVEYTLTVTDVATGAVRTYHNPPYTLASHVDTEAFAEAGTAAPVVQASAAARLPKVSVAGEPCAPGAEALCLQGQRFTVAVDWTDPRTGQRGRGTAVPLSGDSGYFWFFAPGNVELVVKVLDGQAVNGHFWVFYASLSDVAYSVTVTDVQTARTRTYHNPPYTLASRADTQAF